MHIIFFQNLIHSCTCLYTHICIHQNKNFLFSISLHYLQYLLKSYTSPNYMQGLLKEVYAAHLLTTPISDNMMSRLIFILTKQFFDNQFTHFKIKTWIVLCRMQVFKGTIFCCVRSCRRKCYNNCYFSYQMFLLIDGIFSIWKRSKGS